MHKTPVIMVSALSAALAGGAVGQPAPAAAPAGEAEAAGEGSSALEATYERRELAGFPLMVSREFATEDPELLERVLLQLEADLDEVCAVVPGPALAALRRTTVWVELQGAVVEGGMSGRGMCCHWSADWLASAGLPREKAGGVEIVNAADFLEWRRSQPYMTLHELAHAYHRMLGADLPEIVETYGAAMEAGIYEGVGRNSVPAGETVRAYAATNHFEYFAELSEAYFALNDFVPYTRSQLAAMDPAGLAMVERLWSLPAEEIADKMKAAGVADAGVDEIEMDEAGMNEAP